MSISKILDEVCDESGGIFLLMDTLYDQVFDKIMDLEEPERSWELFSAVRKCCIDLRGGGDQSESGDGGGCVGEEAEPTAAEKDLFSTEFFSYARNDWVTWGDATAKDHRMTAAHHLQQVYVEK